VGNVERIPVARETYVAETGHESVGFFVAAVMRRASRETACPAERYCAERGTRFHVTGPANGGMKKVIRRLAGRWACRAGGTIIEGARRTLASHGSQVPFRD